MLAMLAEPCDDCGLRFCASPSPAYIFSLFAVVGIAPSSWFVAVLCALLLGVAFWFHRRAGSQRPGRLRSRTAS
jgi:hypothetical protein